MKTFAITKWDGQALSFLDTDDPKVLAQIIADSRRKGQKQDLSPEAQERHRVRFMRHIAGEESEQVLRLHVRLREAEDELENARTEMRLKDEAYVALRKLFEQWAPSGMEMVG